MIDVQCGGMSEEEQPLVQIVGQIGQRLVELRQFEDMEFDLIREEDSARLFAQPKAVVRTGQFREQDVVHHQHGNGRPQFCIVVALSQLFGVQLRPIEQHPFPQSMVQPNLHLDVEHPPRFVASLDVQHGQLVVECLQRKKRIQNDDRLDSLSHRPP